MKLELSRSASLPVEITWLRPTSCCQASVDRKYAVAPLCDTIATPLLREGAFTGVVHM